MGELRQVCKCIVGTVATQEMEQIFTLADNSVPLTKSKLLIDTVAQQPSIYAEYIRYILYICSRSQHSTMSKNNGLEKFAIS